MVTGYDLEELKSISNFLISSKNALETPLVEFPLDFFAKPTKKLGEVQVTPRLFLKLESMQISGSFKMRGVANLFRELSSQHGDSISSGPLNLVTMSAGNFGKTFAMMAQKSQANGIVCMPDTAPKDRIDVIKSFGAKVLISPSSELLSTVQKLQKDDPTLAFAHPFDDIRLIKGYGSIAIEIMKQLPSDLGENDFVVIPCGGGGLLSGVSAYIRASGCQAQIIGVEPESAPGQYNSRVSGQAVSVQLKPTIASGLAAPFAGSLCYDIISECVDNIVLVSDRSIKLAMRQLFENGLVVEPSGGAAVAALDQILVLYDSKINADSKFVVLLSGRNVTPKDLQKWIYDEDEEECK